MYNRYVPQPDGSYRRNRMQEPQRPVPPPPQQTGPTAYTNRNSEPADAPPDNRTNRQTQRKRTVPTSAGSFLRQLLPGNLDTEDLLIVILMLLMAGDCEEERSNALLTLALYLFL